MGFLCAGDGGLDVPQFKKRSTNKRDIEVADPAIIRLLFLPSGG